MPNFDETTEEPTVLPTPFPNLLVNGSTGIAVGMATSIPPHNMREVIDGVIAVIERRTAPRDERFRALLQAVPGPDFPSGGTIVGREGIYRAYREGRGGVVVRGKATFEEHKKGERVSIVITEIPYQVNKSDADRRDRRARPRQEASKASPICATSPTATACGSSSSSSAASCRTSC